MDWLFKSNELIIETFRVKGMDLTCGCNAIRLTHKPTKIVVTSEARGSLSYNRDKAFEQLEERLRKYYESNA